MAENVETTIPPLASTTKTLSHPRRSASLASNPKPLSTLPNANNVSMLDPPFQPQNENVNLFSKLILSTQSSVQSGVSSLAAAGSVATGLASQIYQSMPTLPKFMRRESAIKHRPINPRRFSLINYLGSNEKVVRRIFEFLPYLHARRCSRVCSFWRTVSRDILISQEFIVAISPSSPLPNTSASNLPPSITLNTDDGTITIRLYLWKFHPLGSNLYLSSFLPIGISPNDDNESDEIIARLDFLRFLSENISTVSFRHCDSTDYILKWTIQKQEWGTTPTLDASNHKNTIYNSHFILSIPSPASSPLKFSTLHKTYRSLQPHNHAPPPTISIYDNKRYEVLQKLFIREGIEQTLYDKSNMDIRHLLSCPPKTEDISLGFRPVIERLQHSSLEESHQKVKSVLEQLERSQHKIDIVDSIIIANTVPEPQKGFRIPLISQQSSTDAAKKEMSELERVAAMERKKNAMLKRVEYLNQYASSWFKLKGGKVYLSLTGYSGDFEDSEGVYEHLKIWVLPAFGSKDTLMDV
ncbi:hypothetical protein HK098_008388 [Nowakowskiella sp. JEL0407]|nr:hypothetical protein HK098_008378 [Nowakowskiella sp. JEL0407]KAJ3125599.1 hypothetical protein HK098_008388 [Nowakowskiella sp. JEL0407]